MLTKDLISNSIPYLHLEDKVTHALQLMNDYHVAHLPIVEAEQYLGIISEEQLLHSDDENILKELPISDGGSAVQADDHFLRAIQVAVQHKLSVVPVLGAEKHILGLVTYTDLLKNASEFMSLDQPGGLIVLEMEPKAYAFNEINRIVESSDAQITQLNSFADPETGLLQVTIRVSKMEISDIIATLQRYEYVVKYYFGEEMYQNELRRNFDNLMSYLKL